MLLDLALQVVEVRLVEFLELHHLLVDLRLEGAGCIPDVRDAAAHAGREVATGLAEHHCPAAGHVFAAVVARALHHRLGAAVPHAEPLTADAPDEDLTARRPVGHHVAGDDVVFGGEGRRAVGLHDHAAA